MGLGRKRVLQPFDVTDIPDGCVAGMASGLKGQKHLKELNLVDQEDGGEIT